MKAKIELVENHEFQELTSPAWQLVHHVPGRSRYHVHELLDNPKLGLWLSGVLQRDPKVTRAQVRWQTGSVIIEREEADIPPAFDLNRWLDDAIYRRDLDESRLALQNESAGRVPEEEKKWLSPPPEEVLQQLGVARDRGIALGEVEIRRKVHGANFLEEIPPVSHWETFQRQFANSQTALLAGSAVLSLATGGVFDLFMIGGVLAVNGYIGYLSEVNAEEVIYSIGRVEPFELQVLRDGQTVTILDEELVFGDLVFLGIGVVPADIRLIESHGLMVDESPLTGESMPMAKHHKSLDPAVVHSISDQNNLLFRGTIITSGHGLGAVIATGEDTKIGEVRRLVSTTAEQESTLERDLGHIGRQTIWFSSFVCGGVFALGLWRRIGWLEMLKTSISLAVAAVPEGLPTIGTTTMAMGVSRLKRSNVLVRRLKVMEALGSIQILCLDKTGTLTLNEMVASQGYWGLTPWDRPGIEANSGQEDGLDPLKLARQPTFSLIASLCHDCVWLSAHDDEPARWSGSATERAVIDLVTLMGADPRHLKQSFPRLRTSYRTEKRHYMVTYHNLENSSVNLAAIKGSPEQLLELCGWYLDQGVRTLMTDSVKTIFREQNRQLGKKGLRVLSFAYAEGEDLRTIQGQELTWLGLVGLVDPMREGMAELIEAFHRAGIQTIMMTGDQRATAKAVGKALGFNRPGEKVKIADARELSAMTLEQIADLAANVQVFSRVNPSDKLRIIQALQSRGKIVAMTGDGINDSPALKAAHVGIAMGFQGTSAARESADIVLRDDNLEILFQAIQQGRAIHSNLRKSIKYLLGTNLSEILLMLVSIASGRGSPLSSIQLLWINLLSDVLPGLALALDPPAANIMEQNPPHPDAAILPPEVQKILFREACSMALAAFTVHDRQKQRHQGNPLEATTAAFITLTVSQILHTLSASADRQGLVAAGLPRNKRIYQAMGVAAVTLALGTSSPALQKILGMAPLAGTQWRDALLLGLTPLVFNEGMTYLRKGSLTADSNL